MKAWHVNDVMTADVVFAAPGALYRDLVGLLAGRRVNAVPIVDEDRRVLGVVSESDLLLKIEYAGAARPRWFQRRRRDQRRKADALTAAELMTVPAVTVLGSTGTRAAARLMDDARVKQLPVVDDLGRLTGIVSRSDLLKEHLRTDFEILADVRAAIDEVLFTENVAEVDAEVRRGVVTLTGRTERWSSAVLTARLVRLVPGVVETVDRITFDFDDRKLADPVPAFFVA
ncbi:CBS domain-containing protein [Actinoplanes sp. NPDC049802]|uniref:CBS domain-containing protein n=1 Tax=Actinoplanes sp. NPDC049802 TaxID=3154742 RepID=UPI0033F41B4B